VRRRYAAARSEASHRGGKPHRDLVRDSDSSYFDDAPIGERTGSRERSRDALPSEGP